MKIDIIVMLLALIVGSYLAVVFFLYIFQRHLLYHPDQSNIDPVSINASRVLVENWKSHDGLQVPVWVRHPVSRADEVKKFYILYFHGNAGEVSWRYQRLRPVLETGVGLILPNYRYNAGIGGDPDGEKLILDAKSHVAYLKQELGISNDQIILYGESLGSGIALELASLGVGRAVILDGAYPSILEIAQARYPWIPVQYLLKDNFDNLSSVMNVEIPILQIHGTEDRLIPLERARKIANTNTEFVTLKIVEGGGHSDLYDYGAARLINEFLSKLD